MKGPALRWISIRSTRTSRRRFGEIVVLIRQEVEVETTPHRKAKGRQATAFVPKAPSNVARIPRGCSESFSMLFNAFQSSLMTLMVLSHESTPQVDFRDETEELDVEEEDGPKRAVHGRKVTAFVKKSQVQAVRGSGRPSCCERQSSSEAFKEAPVEGCKEV